MERDTVILFCKDVFFSFLFFLSECDCLFYIKTCGLLYFQYEMEALMEVTYQYWIGSAIQGRG